MKNNCGHIMAVLVEQRTAQAPRLQEVLTEHGCLVRMRLGLHETTADYCSEEGLILLHVCGTSEEIGQLAADLDALAGVRTKTLSLE
jgi:hypothetical protein